LFSYVAAQNGLLAFGGANDGDEHFDGGGFAAPFGSKETEDFAFLNAKIDVSTAFRVLVVDFGESLNFYDVFGCLAHGDSPWR
jgi:hypothetical protein